jgi:hypothetical protein
MYNRAASEKVEYEESLEGCKAARIFSKPSFFARSEFKAI